METTNQYHSTHRQYHSTKSFTNGETWIDPIIVVRDSWDTKGYRIYWAPDEDADSCVQVDGEINGEVFRTIAEASSAARVRFPGVTVVRWR